MGWITSKWNMLVMCFIFHIPKGNLIPRSHSDAKRWGTCLETWVHDSDNFGLKSTVNVPCEQCFLKARHYASMRKKLLRATVCFSIEHARPRDDYEYPTTRRQRELQQNNRFNKQNNNFARASRFYFCISLPFLHDYDVKMPNFAFHG